MHGVTVKKSYSDDQEITCGTLFLKKCPIWTEVYII